LQNAACGGYNGASMGGPARIARTDIPSEAPPPMTPSRRLPAAVVLLACVGLSAHAADWPQWRGPFLNGSTTETGLPERWSKTDNVAWATPMPGPSGATPIVWGRRVFVTAFAKAPQGRGLGEVLGLCLDTGSGKILWQARLGPNRFAMGRNHAANNSAATDGTTVWFYTGTGNLAAFDFEGKRLWARELEKKHGRFVVKWGYHPTPLLAWGRLFIPVFQNPSPTKYNSPSGGRAGPLPSFLLAIDPATGEELWKHIRATDATDESTEGYFTLMPHEHGGRRELIAVAGEYATGHDPETGDELWRWEFSPHDRQKWQRVVTSPIVGEGLIYAQRPKHRALFALKAGASGRVGDEIVAWKFTGPTPDASTSLLYRGRLYLVDGDKKAMACLDAKTGEKKWAARLHMRGAVRASPTGADGRVYLISEGGDAVVLAAGDEFKLLAKIPMGERRCRATIVAAQGKLFLRTARTLYCLAKAPPTTQ